MITATLTESRKRLGDVIDLARKGEDVVIPRDSKPVATIQPLDDWDQVTKLPDEDAAKLDRWIEVVPKHTFSSAEAAVSYMKKRAAKRR